MVGEGARYESIGRTYTATRRPDPRIAAQLLDALGDARTVVDVGAGSGSYEPTDRTVVAVEPSATMLGQRRPGQAPAIRGVAEALPVRDASFDAALAVLTIHHWSDLDAGLAELARVSARQVILFCEPLGLHDFWPLEYFPGVRDLPVERAAPGTDDIGRVLDLRAVVPVPVPADCQDGFAAAFWQRPEAYADPLVQAGMSVLALLSEDERRAGRERLLADVASGEWDRRHGYLRDRDTYDAGYRIAVAGS